MMLEELLDREAIRALITAYNMAGDRGRMADLAATFAPAGVLITSGGRHGRHESVGPDAIAQTLSTARAGGEGPDRPLEIVRHNLTTCEVVLTGPLTATGRTYFTVFSEIGLDHIGLYVDRFCKIGDEWKIARREVRIDWTAPGAHTRVTRRAKG